MSASLPCCQKYFNYFTSALILHVSIVLRHEKKKNEAQSGEFTQVSWRQGNVQEQVLLTCTSGMPPSSFFLQDGFSKERQTGPSFG